MIFKCEINLFRNVITATVPKLIFATPVPPTITGFTQRATHHEMLNVYLKRDQIDQYTTKQVILPEDDDADDFEIKLCHRDFCCEFIFNVTFLPVPLGKVGVVI